MCKAFDDYNFAFLYVLFDDKIYILNNGYGGLVLSYYS